jgi:hypothetical protein
MREALPTTVSPTSDGVDPDLPLSRVDRLGMVVSSLCLIHCLALPLIIAVLPALAGTLPSDAMVHSTLILIALPVTGYALLRGYRTHRRARPLLIGAAGMLLVAAALFVGPFLYAEQALTILGGLLVTGAHLINWRSAGHHAGDGHGH